MTLLKPWTRKYKLEMCNVTEALLLVEDCLSMLGVWLRNVVSVGLKRCLVIDLSKREAISSHYCEILVFRD